MPLIFRLLGGLLWVCCGWYGGRLRACAAAAHRRKSHTLQLPLAGSIHFYSTQLALHVLRRHALAFALARAVVFVYVDACIFVRRGGAGGKQC